MSLRGDCGVNLRVLLALEEDAFAAAIKAEVEQCFPSFAALYKVFFFWFGCLRLANDIDFVPMVIGVTFGLIFGTTDALTGDAAAPLNFLLFSIAPGESFSFFLFRADRRTGASS